MPAEGDRDNDNELYNPSYAFWAVLVTGHSTLEPS